MKQKINSNKQEDLSPIKKNQAKERQEKIQELRMQNDKEFMTELQTLLSKYKKVPSINFIDER